MADAIGFYDVDRYDVIGVGMGSPLPVAGSLPYAGTSTPLAAGATFTGSTRDTGVPVGSAQPWAYFNGFFRADQTGTASIESSADGTTWFTSATSALAANTPLILQVPVFYQFNRVKLANGATLQGSVNVASTYTAS